MRNNYMIRLHLGNRRFVGQKEMNLMYCLYKGPWRSLRKNHSSVCFDSSVCCVSESPLFQGHFQEWSVGSTQEPSFFR